MSYLIVGLGNIGFEYVDTRHNIGFIVLDAWAKASNTSFVSGKYGSTAELRFKGRKITLLKPSTFMNLSGRAVNYWMQNLGVKIEDVLIIADDLALPFTTIRMRKKGSDGGHNGLKHIIETLGHSNYVRLRIGIGDSFRQGGQIDYVLGKWTKDEISELPFLCDACIDAAKAFVAIGPDGAMNQCNTKKQQPADS